MPLYNTHFENITHYIDVYKHLQNLKIVLTFSSKVTVTLVQCTNIKDLIANLYLIEDRKLLVEAVRQGAELDSRQINFTDRPRRVADSCNGVLK